MLEFGDESDRVQDDGMISATFASDVVSITRCPLTPEPRARLRITSLWLPAVTEIASCWKLTLMLEGVESESQHPDSEAATKTSAR